MTEKVGHFRDEPGRAEYLRHYKAAFAGLPAPDTTQDVPTSFGMVRTYIWNTTSTQTPVILIPGRASGVPMWSENLPGIIARGPVIAFDALGDAGLSVQTKPFEGFEDIATWMNEVVEALAPGGAHVVGHSFGGAIAAAYARLHPAQVVSLALLEPVLTFAWPPPKLMAWTIVGSLPFLPKEQREHALGKIGGEDFDAAANDPMAQMISAAAEHFTAQLPNPRPLTAEQAAWVTMPTYVAIADRDSVAGGAVAAERARQLLPHATVMTWPNTTHSLPMQAAAELEVVLTKFWFANDR